MCATKGNYAFIDGNNLYLSAKGLGWKISNVRFRTYLKDKYHIDVAYYFIGYIKENEGLYNNLRNSGFTLIFKKVGHDVDNKPKGNVDAELVLQAMIDIEEYEKALIVTSDGDFACLVTHLIKMGKLLKVLAASKKGCSDILSDASGPNIDYLDFLRSKIEYIKK
jgi:uncharacterized LabA/DUF88 family protein